MSALDLDQSLDSIIKSSGPRGGSRRRGGGRGRRDNRNSPYNRDRRAKGQQTTVQVQVPVPFTGLQQGIAPQTSNEISISNLKYDVTADDLKTLAAEYGKIRRLDMNYDQSGRSKGTANVIFQNAADAARFVQDFNDRLLDNRPMKVRFVYAPGAPQPGLHYYQQPQLISVPVPAAGQTSSRGSNNGVSKSTRRQGGGRTQGRRGGRQNKGRPTKEQLDRDLDSMMQVDEEPAKPASTAAINPAA